MFQFFTPKIFPWNTHMTNSPKKFFLENNFDKFTLTNSSLTTTFATSTVLWASFPVSIATVSNLLSLAGQYILSRQNFLTVRTSPKNLSITSNFSPISWAQAKTLNYTEKPSQKTTTTTFLIWEYLSRIFPF